MHWRVFATFPSISREPIQAYQGEDFEAVCRRIGHMVMSKDVAEITVMHGSETYRTLSVQCKELTRATTEECKR